MDQRGAVQPKALILFGAPGSGKGTQAALLKERLAVPHISTGDMLRARIAAGDSLGVRVQSLMASGLLVPDEAVNQLVADRTSEPDCQGGFILDGYPRTLAQAVLLMGLLTTRAVTPVVIHLKVDYTRIIARIVSRWQCSRCGTLYNLASQPPKVAGCCDRDGTPLFQRDDDREDVVRARLEGYDRQTKPLIEYFAALEGRFHTLEATEGSPAEILERICQVLN